jgi:protein-S-isoprenylcysteine O-methyltransferase Ste14
MDLGRIVMAPLCAFVILHNGLEMYRSYHGAEKIDALDILAEINALLLISFYIFMASAYMQRTSPKSTSRSWKDNAAAMGTTFLTAPLLVICSTSVNSPFYLVLTGSVIGILGLAFAVYSLISLGGNFSIIPQAREVVRRGPYRYLRHPLYFGEIVAICGFVLAHVTVTTLVILLMLFLLQVYRANREEKMLASTFPDYQEYVSQTFCIVPGIW